MKDRLNEIETYLSEMEKKPFGYGNEFPTAADWKKLMGDLKWAVGELRIK